MNYIYEINIHDHTNTFMTIAKIIEFVAIAIQNFSYFILKTET